MTFRATLVPSLVLVLGAAVGCGSTPPAPVDVSPPKIGPSVETKPSPTGREPLKAKADTRLDVKGYPASIVAPAGWMHLQVGHAVLVQSDDRGAGLFLFGAHDQDEMKDLIGKLGKELHLELESAEPKEDEVVIDKVRFIRLTYPDSTISTHPAVVTVGIKPIGTMIVVFFAYALRDSPRNAARLDSVVQSILVHDP